MTLFFPDVNVWLALSVDGHSHNRDAWQWMRHLSPDATLVFSRFTQIGLLRLLSNSAAMRSQALKLQEAWSIYDHWLEDPRVEFYPEPRGVGAAFRQVTEPFASAQASKAVGDCWLLAFSAGIHATLVTFDRALHDFARKQAYPSIIPA